MPRLYRLWLLCTTALLRINFRAKLRIFVSFLQIVAQIDRVYALRYSRAFRDLVHALTFFLPGLSTEFGPIGTEESRCIFGSLRAQLLSTALVPLGIAALPFVVKPWLREHAALSYALAWAFLVLPPITSFSFRALAPCDCFDYVGGDGRQTCFLRLDYEVECTGEGPMSASPDVLWAAWTGVGVWAVAVPLAHLALLQLGMRKDDALVGDYRPDRQWWEVVVVLEKLALTGFLALYNPGAWQQLFVATVIALFCFVLQMLVRPYRRESDNTFALLTSLSLVPLFLGSLALQVDATITIYRISAVGGSKLELALLFGFVILVLVALAALFVWEHSQAREVLVLQSTGRPPELAPPPPNWHIFLSHNWDNQDTVATIKRQLQRLLPGVRVFLDVDDLRSVDALETYVNDSATVLILLGSPRYFKSANCLREVTAAKNKCLPLVCVHDADPQKNGSSLDVLRAVCPEEHRDYIFDGEVILWHRLPPFQRVAIALIAEQVVLASSAPTSDWGGGCALRVVGGLAWAKLYFAHPASVYVSEHNPQARAALATLQEHFPGMIEAVKDARHATAWLLFLSADCFEGDRGQRLASEAQAMLKQGHAAPVMVYDPLANPFGEIIGATKVRASALLELRLFDALAIEWHDGYMGEVTVRLVALRLGAHHWVRSWFPRLPWRRPDQPHAPPGFLRTRKGRLIERPRAMSSEVTRERQRLRGRPAAEILALERQSTNHEMSNVVHEAL